MTIPMETPAKLLPAVLDGRVVRYGCILKEAATGQIVGHLKEVGPVAAWLAGGPLGPVAMGVQTLATVGEWADTRRHLARIENSLRHLQLIGSVGAAASVVGLGVSVAGFGLVLRRLGRLESRLNEAMAGLRAEVERVHLRLDMLQAGELRAAWEKLEGAGRTGSPARTADMLRDADGVFQRHRNYYYELITGLRPLEQVRLGLPQGRELLGRLFACGQAELEANFLLGDLEQWRYRHEVICCQVVTACRFDPKDALRARVDDLGGLVPNSRLRELGEQVALTRDFCRESQARVESAGAEVDWLERTRVAPADYLRELTRRRDEGVLLVPHDRVGGTRADSGPPSAGDGVPPHWLKRLASKGRDWLRWRPRRVGGDRAP